MMEKNKKNKTPTPQDCYDCLLDIIAKQIHDNYIQQVAIEILDTLVEQLMNGEGWQG